MGVITCSCMVLAPSFAALATAQDPPPPTVSLGSAVVSITPRICILSEDIDECEESVQLEWKADTERSLCLYESASSTPIQCWQNQQQGNIQLPLSVSETVEFELRDYNDSLLVLAKTEFKVMHDKKKYRRSRRNPWSFF